jgi:DNA-binding NarL/FixJ family response regulator
MSDDIPRLSPLPEIAAIWKSLTPSEQRVAVSIADGLSTQQIAARLGVGFETVKTHTSRILAKFDVRSRLQVAAKFMAEVA